VRSCNTVFASNTPADAAGAGNTAPPVAGQNAKEGGEQAGCIRQDICLRDLVSGSRRSNCHIMCDGNMTMVWPPVV
jgi:hypothetical protein